MFSGFRSFYRDWNACDVLHHRVPNAAPLVLLSFSPFWSLTLPWPYRGYTQFFARSCIVSLGTLARYDAFGFTIAYKGTGSQGSVTVRNSPGKSHCQAIFWTEVVRCFMTPILNVRRTRKLLSHAIVGDHVFILQYTQNGSKTAKSSFGIW